jgi:hypothetical protein
VVLSEVKHDLASWLSLVCPSPEQPLLWRQTNEMPTSQLMEAVWPCYISIIVGMLTLMRTRWSGGLLAACLTCLLAIQALVASVGLGMSAASPFGHPVFDICSAAGTESVAAPAGDNDRNQPRRQPQCPFCFIAAQSASHPAMVPHAKAFPPFAVRDVAAPPFCDPSHHVVPGRLYRPTGDARGPPSFSV